MLCLQQLCYKQERRLSVLVIRISPEIVVTAPPVGSVFFHTCNCFSHIFRLVRPTDQIIIYRSNNCPSCASRLLLISMVYKIFVKHSSLPTIALRDSTFRTQTRTCVKYESHGGKQFRIIKKKHRIIQPENKKKSEIIIIMRT